MEVFRQTAPESTPKKQYTKEESRFIRSKLPLRHAFKIGVSGLRTKPIRLFFTVLLCSVAFVLFGLLSTLNFYDSEATFRQTMLDSEISAVKLNKDYKATNIWYSYGEEMHTYETWYESKFTSAELQKLASELNPNAFGTIGNGGSFNLRQVESAYWQNYIRAFAFLPEGNSLRNQLQGEYPEKKGEIALSSYFADMLVACNAYDSTGNAMELNAAGELIGKTISLSGREFKITGILDSGMMSPDFDVLKESKQTDNYTLQSKLMSLMESSLHSLVFISEDQLTEMAREYRPYKEGRENYMRASVGIKYDGEYSLPEYGNAFYNGVSALPSSQKLYAIAKEGTSLTDQQIILPANQFTSYLADMFGQLAYSLSDRGDYTGYEYYNLLASKCWELSSGGTYQEGDSKEDSIFVPFTDVAFDTAMTELLNAAKDANLDLTVGMRLYDDRNQAYLGDLQIYDIVGVYRSESEHYEQPCYLSDAMANALWEQQKTSISDYSEVMTSYVEDPDAVYTLIYLPGNVPADKIDAYWQLYNNEEFGADSSRIMMRGGFVSSLKTVDYFVKDLSQIFLYVGLVLAVFAALLLSNFISVSISNKKREIGILRAVGARSLDVFKIFFSESFVIGLICVLVSGAACYWLCGMINQEFAIDLGASVFVFGIPSVAVLVGIAAITIVVATFLPVYGAAKKKPVDSIRAL